MTPGDVLLLPDNTPCLLCQHLALSHEIELPVPGRANCLMCSCPLFVPNVDPDCRTCGCERNAHAFNGPCFAHETCKEYAGLKLKRSTLARINRMLAYARTAPNWKPSADPLELIADLLLTYEDFEGE